MRKHCRFFAKIAKIANIAKVAKIANIAELAEIADSVRYKYCFFRGECCG